MYNRFKSKMEKFIVFTTTDIEKYFPDFDRKNLVYWQKKGYIIKIRNNYYCFSDPLLDERFLYFVANKIYTPAYVSLEASLSYYQVIPEGVYTITSVTSLKTNTFLTPFGKFTYRHLKPELFFGYQLQTFRNHSYKVASVEKTILDYLYLNHSIQHADDFIHLRWNKEVLKQLDFERLKNYQLLFQSNALNQRVAYLLNYIYA